MANGLVEYTRTIGAGELSKISAKGTTLFVKSLSGTLRVRVKHGNTGTGGFRSESIITLSEGQKQEYPPSLSFYELIIENTGASAGSITLIAGDGNYEEPSASGGVAATVKSYPKETPGSLDFEIPENPNRLGVYICASAENAPNDETAMIEVYSVLNGDPLGIFLWGGEYCFIPTTAAIWVEGENVLDPSFYYFELEA